MRVSALILHPSLPDFARQGVGSVTLAPKKTHPVSSGARAGQKRHQIHVTFPEKGNQRYCKISLFSVLYLLACLALYRVRFFPSHIKPDPGKSSDRPKEPGKFPEVDERPTQKRHMSPPLTYLPRLRRQDGLLLQPPCLRIGTTGIANAFLYRPHGAVIVRVIACLGERRAQKHT